MTRRSYRVDVPHLPEYWPTHGMPAEFWEELGRIVATFGFLEEILKKAIFTLSATREHRLITLEMYERWARNLEQTVKAPLGGLIDRYEKELKDDESSRSLIDALRDVKEHRDIVCHGSWWPGSDGKKAKPFFVNRRSEIFDSEYGVDDLREIRCLVKEIICLCVNSITSKGIQFPGSNGPGKPVW